jgi:thiol-disulfide isomerase/thioredoxin
VRRFIFLLPVALFAVLLVAFAMGLNHDPSLLPSALIDRPAPDFNLPGLIDPARGLARKDLGGGVTLVNFFASWCAPCREEQPGLMVLARQPGITLDGIAYKDKPADSRHFLDNFGNPLSSHWHRSAWNCCDRFRGLRRARDVYRRRQRTYPLPPCRPTWRAGCQSKDIAADREDRRRRQAAWGRRVMTILVPPQRFGVC